MFICLFWGCPPIKKGGQFFLSMEFFAAIKYFKKKLSREEVTKAIANILRRKEVQEIIIEMNQEQMYELGQDSNGELIGGGGYSPITIWIKEKKGQRVDHITLRDTGDFYNSMTVEVSSGEFIIDADADKGGGHNLFDMYGIDILGLNEDNKERLRELLVREFVFEIKKNAA